MWFKCSNEYTYVLLHLKITNSRIENKINHEFYLSSEIKQLNAIKLYFKEWNHNAHIPIVAEILRPGCMYLYDNPLNYRMLNSVIDALEKAGEELYVNGRISKKWLKLISQKVGSSLDFKKDSNFF